VLGPPAADPAQALWLGHHQDGPAAHEDFVGRGLAHARAGEVIEGREQGRGPLAGGLGPAAELGHAGGARAEYDLQEASGGGQANALGLGGGSELGLAVLVEGGGPVEAPLEVVAVGLDLVGLLAEAEGLLLVAEAVEVVAYGIGLAVDGWPAGAALSGQSCDVAVAAEEGGGGAGDAVEDG
jgi:hypothetical protein